MLKSVLKRFKYINIYLYVLGSILFIFIILCPIVYHFNITSMARITLMDTKNIQLAMRLLSIQYYGQDRNIYQPGEPYGMAEDTIKEIRQLSGAEGEITLVYWNSSKGLPGKFFYKTDSFLAVYEYNSESEEPVWDIYRLKPVMTLGEE